ncbi:BamA/TamA family outer membrane protein [Calditrichota bacterium GD2]
MTIQKNYILPKFNAVFKTIILLLVVLSAVSGAQDKIDFSKFNGKIIKDIFIVGNKQTRAKVILREMQLQEGQVFRDSLLIRSRERLENLWLFNRVEMLPFSSSDSVSIIVSVTERWYFFPYPVLYIVDRDWNKLTYGFGFAHLNFRGWNEKLQSSVHFGNRPGLKFVYENPWVGEDIHLYTRVYFRKFRMDNYKYDFPEYHLLSVVHLGKYWTRDIRTVVMFSRDQVSVDKENVIYMESGNQEDINYGIRLINTFDYRDLYAYPTTGWYLRLGIYKMGLFAPELDYTQYMLDFRKYLSVNSFILAGRVYTMQSYGNTPVYDQVFLGFEERIRGHFNEVYNGRYAMLLGLALRHPLIPLRYFSYHSELLPEFLTKNLKFGLNAGLFVESGQVWNNHKNFKLRNMITGYGFGLHFLLPYVEVLRFDYAFNEQGRGEFIVEVLMPF